MGWFSRQIDPIEERARELERELAELEAQIAASDTGPRFRSSTYPDPARESGELILEEYDQSSLNSPPAQIQEKLDGLSSKPTGLRERLNRLKREFGVTPVGNPKLVKYLSSGNIQGLEPLRYERRVARNRFFFLFFLLLLVLTGLAMVITRNY